MSRTFLISFFKLLQHLFFSTAFRVYHNSFALSRTFLLSFLKKERRRRDLNPRAAINDLLPFQGSPFGQLGYFSIKNGEGGIRTHAPFRTNGFQDRLVMTASISLQVVFVRRHQPATCTYYHFTIFVSTSFFKKFEAIFKSSGVVIFRFSYAPIITFVLTLL